MAININQMRNAINPAATTVPPGWMYDAAMDGYVNDQGLRVDSFEIMNHGGITKAIIAIHGAQALMVATGHVSQAAHPFASMGPMPITSAGSLSISDVKPTNVISIETKLGKVGINIETGDITIPPGIGRDEAIREFWFGFQKVFNPFDKAKYEVEIKKLKDDIQDMKGYYGKALEAAEKKSCSIVAEKIRKKYGNEIGRAHV